MGTEVKVAYLCDGMASCSEKVGCYRCMKPGIDFCSHTFDSRHARNGAVRKPENYPDRFTKLVIPGDDRITYWEGEFEIPDTMIFEEK